MRPLLTIHPKITPKGLWAPKWNMSHKSIWLLPKAKRAQSCSSTSQANQFEPSQHIMD